LILKTPRQAISLIFIRCTIFGFAQLNGSTCGKFISEFSVLKRICSIPNAGKKIDVILGSEGEQALSFS